MNKIEQVVCRVGDERRVVGCRSCRRSGLVSRFVDAEVCSGVQFRPRGPEDFIQVCVWGKPKPKPQPQKGKGVVVVQFSQMRVDEALDFQRHITEALITLGGLRTKPWRKDKDKSKGKRELQSAEAWHEYEG